jgi:MoaA/NifB/PqqE/SkfB family radical SAM enzyme
VKKVPNFVEGLMNEFMRRIAASSRLRKYRINLYTKTNGILGNAFPTLIALPITAQCNFRCNFCEIIGAERKISEGLGKYHSNMFTQEIIQQFEPIIRNVQIINFGGLTYVGEPLLSPYFKDIVAWLRNINKVAMISITTNGFLLNDTLSDFLIEQAPLSIDFSIHAFNKEIYEKVMGRGNTITIKNITNFCKKIKGNSKINTSINFGLGRHNIGEGEEIIEFAKEQEIDSVNIYLYYKSPNAYMEDISLYSNPELANNVLVKLYAKAKEIGQKLEPSLPLYIKQAGDISPVKEVNHNIGCPLAFDNFIMKSDPFHNDRVGLCVCNRIVPFHVNISKKITDADLKWVWKHPIFKAMRLRDTYLEICRFCQAPETPALRSLNYEQYKLNRDEAIRNDLNKFKNEKYSPNKSIELLEDNIHSI